MLSLAGLVLLFATKADAQKIWVNPSSGLWREGTNWSGGTPPTGGTNTTAVWITNANSKVVTIDAGTSATNLVATRLNLWGGGSSSTNTLLMTDVTTDLPLVLGSGSFIGRGGACGLANSALVVQNSLTISNGGSLGITNSAVAVTAGAGMFLNIYGGSAILDSGSFTVRDTNVQVRVGRSTSAALVINGGAMEVAGAMTLGESFNHSQGTLKITGGILTLGSFLTLGESTGSTGVVAMTGGQLVVTNSGTNSFIRVGNIGSGQMTISNAIVSISSGFSIADNPGSAGLVSVTDGGQLTVDTTSTNIIRIGNYGSGQMIVSNASVMLPDVSVGRHPGAIGLLTLQSNALVEIADDLSIGRFGDPVNSAQGSLLMKGGQLIVTNFNTSIWVGREGIGQMAVSNGLVQCQGLLVAAVPTNTASGTLTVAGGTVLVSSNFVVGDAGLSTGKVFMVDGTVNVTNASSSAISDIPNGTMTFNGGTLELDNLRVTNNSGRFIFNGGMLRSGNTTVSNGMPFVVGDGVNPATFQLRGGTHVFADGLVISKNATLSGCGTVIGTISNQGTIATNCGAGSASPSITQQPGNLTVKQGDPATFTVVATGDPPLSYEWRFNGNSVGGAITSSYSIAHAQTSDAGNYDVIVSNSSGSVTSLMATLTVQLPTSITQQPVSLTVKQGDPATFMVVATGDPPLSYQWRFSGLMGNLPGATNSNLVIQAAQETNAGNYRVIVSNTSGSVTSVVATLRVLIPTALTNTVVVGTNLNFSFKSVTGLTYTFEYKTDLSDANWTVLRTLTGNGSLIDLSDPVDVAVPSRYYRIRVE